MSNAVEIEVGILTQKELCIANGKFPPFNSAHEGYAVILEEYEESKEALEAVELGVADIWKTVRFNLPESTYLNAKDLYEDAVHLACEAIQTAAMALKMKQYLSTLNEVNADELE